jgi:hypothetical protein
MTDKWVGCRSLGAKIVPMQVALSFVTTVKDNEKHYTPRGVNCKQAEAARRLQTMRLPSKKLTHILARDSSGTARGKSLRRNR